MSLYVMCEPVSCIIVSYCVRTYGAPYHILWFLLAFGLPFPVVLSDVMIIYYLSKPYNTNGGRFESHFSFS